MCGSEQINGGLKFACSCKLWDAQALLVGLHLVVAMVPESVFDARMMDMSLSSFEY